MPSHNSVLLKRMKAVLMHRNDMDGCMVLSFIEELESELTKIQEETVLRLCEENPDAEDVG